MTPAEYFVDGLRIGANLAGEGKFFPTFPTPNLWKGRTLPVEWFKEFAAQGFTHCRMIIPSQWTQPIGYATPDSGYVAGSRNAAQAGLRTFLAVQDQARISTLNTPEAISAYVATTVPDRARPGRLRGDRGGQEAAQATTGGRMNVGSAGYDLCTNDALRTGMLPVTIDTRRRSDASWSG